MRKSIVLSALLAALVASVLSFGASSVGAEAPPDRPDSGEQCFTEDFQTYECFDVDSSEAAARRSSSKAHFYDNFNYVSYLFAYTGTCNSVQYFGSYGPFVNRVGSWWTTNSCGSNSKTTVINWGAGAQTGRNVPYPWLSVYNGGDLFMVS